MLDDRQIERIKASELNMEGRIGRTDNQFNLFSKVRREVLTVQDLRRKKKTSYNEDILPEVSSLGGKLQFGPARYAEKLKGFIENLEQENKGLFIGSAEYDNVLAFAKVMHTELSHIENSEFPPMSKEQLSGMFETMNALTQVYLDKKAQEDLSKERNASRTFVVQNIADWTANHAARTDMSDRNYYRHLCFEKRIGGFSGKRHNSVISRAIKAMETDQKKRLAGSVKNSADRAAFVSGQQSISYIFDGVSENAWRETLQEYKNEEKRYSAMLTDLQDETLRKSLSALNASAICAHPNSAAMDAEERLLAVVSKAAADYLKNSENLSADELIAANGLIQLAQRARSGEAFPVSGTENLKNRIAEQMLERLMKKPENKEKLQSLKNPSDYRDTQNRIMAGQNFRKLVEKKKPEQLKKLIRQNNTAKNPEKAAVHPV